MARRDREDPVCQVASPPLVFRINGVKQKMDGWKRDAARSIQYWTNLNWTVPLNDAGHTPRSCVNDVCDTRRGNGYSTSQQRTSRKNGRALIIRNPARKLENQSRQRPRTTITFGSAMSSEVLVAPVSFQLHRVDLSLPSLLLLAFQINLRHKRSVR